MYPTKSERTRRKARDEESRKIKSNVTHTQKNEINIWIKWMNETKPILATKWCWIINSNWNMDGCAGSLAGILGV